MIRSGIVSDRFRPWKESTYWSPTPVILFWHSCLLFFHSFSPSVGVVNQWEHPPADASSGRHSVRGITHPRRTKTSYFVDGFSNFSVTEIIPDWKLSTKYETISIEFFLRARSPFTSPTFKEDFRVLRKSRKTRKSPSFFSFDVTMSNHSLLHLSQTGTESRPGFVYTLEPIRLNWRTPSQRNHHFTDRRLEGKLKVLKTYPSLLLGFFISFRFKIYFFFICLTPYITRTDFEEYFDC